MRLFVTASLYTLLLHRGGKFRMNVLDYHTDDLKTGDDPVSDLVMFTR